MIIGEWIEYILWYHQYILYRIMNVGYTFARVFAGSLGCYMWFAAFGWFEAGWKNGSAGSGLCVWRFFLHMGDPIGSMYAIYGNIYHQYTPNVSIYTSTMDPMGMGSKMATNLPRPFFANFSGQTCHQNFGMGFQQRNPGGAIMRMWQECINKPCGFIQKRALSIIKLNQKTCGGFTTQVITISHPFFGGIPIDVGHIHPRRCTTNMSTPDEAKPFLVRMVNLPISGNLRCYNATPPQFFAARGWHCIFSDLEATVLGCLGLQAPTLCSITWQCNRQICTYQRTIFWMYLI